MDDAVHLDPEFLARQEAGREALRIYHSYGDDVGGSILRGKLTAFLFAYAAVTNWDEALMTVRELAFADREAGSTSKPKLTVYIGGKHESDNSNDRQRTEHPVEAAIPT